jgi:hypothetical protein
MKINALRPNCKCLRPLDDDRIKNNVKRLQRKSSTSSCHFQRAVLNFWLSVFDALMTKKSSNLVFCTHVSPGE